MLTILIIVLLVLLLTGGGYGFRFFDLDGRPIEVGSETVDLRKEDLLSLPPDTAQLLVQAKVAEPVTPGSAHPNVT